MEASIDSNPSYEIDDFPKGSINSWENDYYQPSLTIQTATLSKRKISEMEPDEYDEDYREEEIIGYCGLAMEEEGVLKSSHETRGKTSIDENHKTSIDIHQTTKLDARAEDDANFGSLRVDEFGIFRDSEGQARTLDGLVIQISKDVADTIARARESENLIIQKNKAENTSSIDKRGQPSFDGLFEFGQRTYDSSGNRRFKCETRDEYGIYTDEHGYA